MYIVQAPQAYAVVIGFYIETIALLLYFYRQDQLKKTFKAGRSVDLAYTPLLASPFTIPSFPTASCAAICEASFLL